MLFDKNLYLGQKKKCGSSVLTDPAYSHNKMTDPQLFFLLAAVNFSFLESQVLMWIISHFSGWKCVWIILIYMSPSLSHVIYLLCSSFYTCISDFSHSPCVQVDTIDYDELFLTNRVEKNIFFFSSQKIKSKMRIRLGAGPRSSPV